jgi:phosphate acetyltransferase
MTSFPEEMKEQASTRGGTLVLPEGGDERVAEAATRLAEEGIAERVIVLNSDSHFQHEAIDTIDPASDPDRDEMAHRLANQSDDLTLADAEDMLTDPLFYGAGLVSVNRADGMVAGADNPTANVLRAALNVLGTTEASSVVSSSFVMEVQDASYGQNGRMLFTDPAVVPNPDDDQLSEMAGDAVQLYRDLIAEGEPRVAFLSFSTRGSAEHEMVDKMSDAYEKFKESHPDVTADGELQADAAIVPDVANRKAPDSELAGRANILMFPDLDAANIGYKLVQRLGDAGAYGPFLQGLNGAVNDLSRGCSVDDVVTVGAVTLVQGTTS